MNASHGHGQAVTATGRHRGRLAAVMAISAAIAAGEVAGGLVSGSLVLLADAAHMAADAAGVGLSLLAAHFATRPATPRRTFGYARAEILAATGNALLLLVLATFILIEAFRRLGSPPSVSTSLMVIVGIVALAGNGTSVILLRGAQAESLNARGAFLEVASDTFGAAAVIVTGVIIAGTGATIADPIASIAVGVLILPRAWNLLREAVDVLLEASPRGVDLSEVREHMTGLDGVLDVHDLHAWTITSGLPVLSAHVVVDPAVLATGRSPIMLDKLQECLRGHFDVAHSTFQIEPAGHADHEPSVHS
ncbi:MAG TPA: cation diffusion facilitator family transporter [Streptosporangiaceae bacterium]|jgi:cobalt-zinc-cadmium efflux system protein|nr:cation diffusion facilitator family transporter [Streptosporangiaceae bacterium]